MFCADRSVPLSVVESVQRCISPGDRLTPLVARLRWVVGAVIVIGTLLTLLGQPAGFWADPTTAIRGDGLSIYAATNHSFDYFLGHGALAFVATRLLGLAAVLFVVSRLPRIPAVVTMFSLILVQGYGIGNWLVVGFHLGIGGGVPTGGAVLGTLLSFAILPSSKEPRAVVDLWRWVMVAALFGDVAVTLVGQPASYWHDPATVHEGNALARVFLARGWMYYLGLEAVLAAGQFALVTILPLPIGFVSVFAFIYGGFVGASNWFFYEWRLGWIAPTFYAAVVSTLLVVPAFRDRKEATTGPG